KKFATICVAHYSLYKADVLNKNFTCNPSFEEKIRLDGYSKEDVVVDENVKTSRGPATAMKFALEIVKTLTSKETYQNVKNGLLA
ncbi:DJ-1/PfpI family protein, partial [Aliarcobacter butzleri]